MEDWSSVSTRSLIDRIVVHFAGCTSKNPSVIKLNSENLSVHGDLYLLYSFKAWQNFLVCGKSCTSILQHYAHTRSIKKDNASTDTTEEIFKQLISESNNWPIKLERCALQGERVCVFLKRGDVIANSIRMAFKCGRTFGSNPSAGKTFSLKCQPDAESDLTTQRLHLMKTVAAKVLNLHGHVLLDEKSSAIKYIFTSKSEGPVAEGYQKYVCGVVKNSQSNSKEVRLSWQQYMKRRMLQLAESNEHKLRNESKVDEINDPFLHSLASAIGIFELLAVKPSRSVVIGNDDKNITNTRGASFILYNTARIATIIAKYNEKVSRGDYPSLPDIEDIDFSQLQEEEEWELVYNFIFGFPQILTDCLICEPNFQIYPQTLCLFLSRLCQKFSVYYRRVKILMEGDHLIPKMIARLYMVHALQIVLENALDILSIKPLSRM